MAGFSQKSVKVALEMASEAIESKQKVIDMLQIEIKEYKTRLEQYDQIHRDAQQLVYGVDHGSQETEAESGSCKHSYDTSIVVILQETLEELHACKCTMQEQQKRLEVLDIVSKNGHLGKENRRGDAACTSALYEKLLKEKDDTISELALLLASREQALRDAFAQAIIASHSLPSSPRQE
jgi:transposase